MEDKPSREYQPAGFEVQLNTADRLRGRLGFIETDELKTVREQAVVAFSIDDAEKVGALTLEYQLLGEELVNNLQGREYMRGQIGLIVAKATLHRETGNLEAFLHDIRDAREYAFDAYEDDIVRALEKLPSIEIARTLSTIGDDFGLDEETIAEMAATPYDQAFETAYGYLIQEGLDADVILSAFIDNTPHTSEDLE
jgi:hypothetical protein